MRRETVNKIKSYVTLLSVVVTAIALYRTALTILMFALGLVHANHYTYWNYIMETIFYVLLWVSYVTYSARLFRLLTLILFPIVFGSAIFVYFYIIVILQLDGGALFIRATVFAGGTHSVGTVHTVDQIVHTFPAIDIIVLLLCGFLQDARHISRRFYKALQGGSQRFMFALFYFVGPLIPFALYSCFFNPFREYPTHITNIVPLSIGVVIYVLILWVLYRVMTSGTYGHFRNTRIEEEPMEIRS
jgi:hypothetical protein